MITIPEDNLYTREHEWVRIEGNKAEVESLNMLKNHSVTLYMLNYLKLETKLMQEMNLVQLNR